MEVGGEEKVVEEMLRPGVLPERVLGLQVVESCFAAVSEWRRTGRLVDRCRSGCGGERGEG